MAITFRDGVLVRLVRKLQDPQQSTYFNCRNNQSKIIKLDSKDTINNFIRKLESFNVEKKSRKRSHGSWNLQYWEVQSSMSS